MSYERNVRLFLSLDKRRFNGVQVDNNSTFNRYIFDDILPKSE